MTHITDKDIKAGKALLKDHGATEEQIKVFNGVKAHGTTTDYDLPFSALYYKGEYVGQIDRKTFELKVATRGKSEKVAFVGDTFSRALVYALTSQTWHPDFKTARLRKITSTNNLTFVGRVYRANDDQLIDTVYVTAKTPIQAQSLILDTRSVKNYRNKRGYRITVEMQETSIQLG